MGSEGAESDLLLVRDPEADLLALRLLERLSDLLREDLLGERRAPRLALSESLGTNVSRTEL